MATTLVDLVFDAPQEPEALMQAAFPGARELIADDAYLSDTDENVFRRFVRNVLEPAVAKANEAVKDGLRACLQPRTAAAVAAASAGINFVGGFLPSYPPGLAPVVAALVVLSAHELRSRGRI